MNRRTWGYGLVGLMVWAVAAHAAPLKKGDTVRLTEDARVVTITAVAKNGNVKAQGASGLTIGYESQALYEPLPAPAPDLPPVPEPSPTPLPSPVPTPLALQAALTVAGTTQTAALDWSAPSVPLGPVSLYLYPYTFQSHQALDLTLADDQRIEDVNQPRPFEATAYTLTIPGSFPTYAIGGENGQVYRGDVPPEGVRLYQGGEARFKDGNYLGYAQWYDGVGSGTAAPGYVLAGSTGVVVRHFAQQFPKGFTIYPDRLVIELHPERASTEAYQPGTDYHRPKTFYFPREGGAKTYQLLIASGVDLPALQALASAFEAAPRPIQAPDITVHPAPGYDRYLAEAVLTPSLAKPSLIALAGWRDFGDRLRPGWAGVWNDVRIPSFYNGTHVGATQFFDQWQRTQDPRWWRLFEDETRHFMDLDVSHARRRGYHFGGLLSPAGEPHLIKHEVIDHASRNVHAGHLHLSGLVDYWLVTGDPRAKVVLDELGTWLVWYASRSYPETVTWPHWAEAERDFAWALWCLNELGRGTGEARYAETAAQVTRHLIGWWQLDQPHLQGGQVVGQNDADAGTGFWTMHPRCDNCPTGYNGTNPWMAGAALTALIQFREADQGQRINQAVLDTMILQVLQYVVTWGYRQDKGFFVYSEANRDLDGGKNHLLYPLAWGARRIAQGVPHPEWYDTAPLWQAIARAAYDDWQVVKWRGSNALGFYGYEFLPSAFWRLMQED